MTKEQEVVRSVFDAYIRDIKAVSDKDRPTIDMLEEVKSKTIKALELVEEFEKAQIITGGRLNGRTYAYKRGLEDGKRKALEQQPSDDCVSREKVWYMITGGKYPNEDYEQFIDRLVKELENMPPVTPTFPKGATNGDMIKAMFPNSETYFYEKYGLRDDHYSTIIGEDEVNCNICCDVDWWNAPYKRNR